jgi:AcrR family transcriptional regulator
MYVCCKARRAEGAGRVNQSLPKRTLAPLPRPAKVARSRQQARTDATRRKLLLAAEKIFARDGFEAARLEDIASLAGYTRGAFYANFQSKEDIFFALLEHWFAQRISEVNAVLAQQESPAKLLASLREHYAQKDRRLSLLSLEFKLFAIRHPEALARLRARQRRIRACGGDVLRRVARITGRALPVSHSAAATGLGALSSALALEHFFDPSMVSDQETRHLLGVFFDAVLGTKPAR